MSFEETMETTETLKQKKRSNHESSVLNMKEKLPEQVLNLIRPPFSFIVYKLVWIVTEIWRNVFVNFSWSRHALRLAAPLCKLFNYTCCVFILCCLRLKVFFRYIITFSLPSELISADIYRTEFAFCYSFFLPPRCGGAFKTVFFWHLDFNLSDKKCCRIFKNILQSQYLKVQLNFDDRTHVVVFNNFLEYLGSNTKGLMLPNLTMQ